MEPSNSNNPASVQQATQQAAQHAAKQIPPQTTQKDRFFRGQGPDEQVLAFCRKHWIAVLPHIVVFSLTVIGVLLFAFNYESLKELYDGGFFQFLVFFLGILLLYYVHRFFLTLIRHNLSVTIITDARVITIHKSLYLINDKETIDLKNIQEVRNLQSGVLQNMFNFGDLGIELSMSSQGAYIDHVPNPDFHFRLINRAKQIYIQKNPQAKSLQPSKSSEPSPQESNLKPKEQQALNKGTVVDGKDL